MEFSKKKSDYWRQSGISRCHHSAIECSPMRAAGYLVVTKSGDWFFRKPGSTSKSLGLGSWQHIFWYIRQQDNEQPQKLFSQHSFFIGALCSACDEGPGVCSRLLTVFSLFLIIVSLPLSLFVVVKVVQVIVIQLWILIFIIIVFVIGIFPALVFWGLLEPLNSLFLRFSWRRTCTVHSAAADDDDYDDYYYADYNDDDDDYNDDYDDDDDNNMGLAFCSRFQLFQNNFTPASKFFHYTSDARLSEF